MLYPLDMVDRAQGVGVPGGLPSRHVIEGVSAAPHGPGRAPSSGRGSDGDSDRDGDGDGDGDGTGAGETEKGLHAVETLDP